jgi:DNA-binding GntR family transcriptional regulator
VSLVTEGLQAEVTALRIVLSNVVARLAAATGTHGSPEIREFLNQMRDECRAAAERAPREAGTDLSGEVLRNIDRLFKGITIRERRYQNS